jgi:integrase
MFYGKRPTGITASDSMATFRQRGKKWQVEVCRLGQRRAKTFDTKSAARHWAAITEADLTARHAMGAFDATGPGLRTVATMLEKYRTEVTPTKRGARWEDLRIGTFLRDPIASIALASLGPPDIAAWRDRRLKVVSSGAVLREMNILTAICNRAVKEWQWLPINPCTGVARPKDPPGRERRVTDAEIAAIAHVCGWHLDKPDQIAVTATQRVAAAMLFAIETAMRAGEICGLTPADIDRTARVARLSKTKNGYGRDVPLSPAALAILDRLPPTDGPVFGLRTSLLDALWRKVRDLAGVAGLHFHDTRHESVSRLAHKMDVLDLARMTGHRDIRMLSRYYHRTASDVAAQLAERDGAG